MIKYDKFVVTEKIISLLPENCSLYQYKKYPLDKTVFFWWEGGRSSTSLRLSPEGKKAFDYAGIKSYKFLIYDGKIIPKSYGLLLEFGKYIDCPWYVNTRNYADDDAFNITVYDSKIATMITLYGSIHDYVNSKKR